MLSDRYVNCSINSFPNNNLTGELKGENYIGFKKFELSQQMIYLLPLNYYFCAF